MMFASSKCFQLLLLLLLVLLSGHALSLVATPSNPLASNNIESPSDQYVSQLPVKEESGSLNGASYDSATYVDAMDTEVVVSPTLLREVSRNGLSAKGIQEIEECHEVIENLKDENDRLLKEKSKLLDDLEKQSSAIEKQNSVTERQEREKSELVEEMEKLLSDNEVQAVKIAKLERSLNESFVSPSHDSDIDDHGEGVGRDTSVSEVIETPSSVAESDFYNSSSLILFPSFSRYQKRSLVDVTRNMSLVTSSASWSGRFRHSSVALDSNTIVLMGGYAGSK
jgi:hypothetical protein